MSELRLYDYPASANCYKARLLLAQLERPYERVPVDIFDGVEVLQILEHHLAAREFLVGSCYSIADVAVYGYVHIAHEAGYDMRRRPAVQEWLSRIARQPGYTNDLQPYPPNARVGAGRSIYG